MKKLLISIVTISLLSVGTVFADEDRIEEIEEEIAEYQEKIEELRSELKELTGNDENIVIETPNAIYEIEDMILIKGRGQTSVAILFEVTALDDSVKIGHGWTDYLHVTQTDDTSISSMNRLHLGLLFENVSDFKDYREYIENDNAMLLEGATAKGHTAYVIEDENDLTEVVFEEFYGTTTETFELNLEDLETLTLTGDDLNYY